MDPITPLGTPQATSPHSPVWIGADGVVASDMVLEENNLRIQLLPSRRKKVKKINLVIEGDFSIYTVSFVKDTCQKLLGYYEMMHIALRNLNVIDLAAVQLLQVLVQQSAEGQRNIHLESELSKEDRALLASAGLLDYLSTNRHN